MYRSRLNFNGLPGTGGGGAKYKCDIKIRDFRPINRYILEMIVDRPTMYLYNGRLVGKCI